MASPRKRQKWVDELKICNIHKLLSFPGRRRRGTMYVLSKGGAPMSMSELTPEAQARLREAVRTAIAREDRTESPRGEWRDRLWYPADDERQDCCENITPTEANRQALESH